MIVKKTKAAKSRTATRKAIKKFCRPKKPKIGFVAVGKTKYKVGTSKAENDWLTALGVFDRQKIIYGFHGKILVVDGIDYNKKIIYEFNGEAFHSILAYPRNKWDVKTWTGKTPRQMYNETVERYNFLYSLGFKIFFVWYKDYKQGKLGRFFKGPGDNLY